MKRKAKRNKSIIFRLFVLGVCAYFVFTLTGLLKSLNESKAQLADLKAQYSSELNDIEELKSLLQSESNDRIIEKAARERLGYIYNNEQIFIDISGS